ncbi:3'(2'),5'-bisphosphate nucleotidase CysQ [Longimicrobium terrae]|uniref:Myo-inositol-1(Or 4)-monophosphatase n=1 Tax=Longimicrobium terrae TaxID=1639882 RepID=A0A841GUX9_9BACT|nr:3'(2'),5'-bisphosphate nucleotidase CysQ [Longimicrobium terrae]MBB4634695.1 myo-inositol-1(or 4)-monophosphatase [Longimicrobium terrae]MBB6068415.1 myo-inositol-1(or 4)-monophosphatase [Longimicrobium terrae]NNC32695.1 3'(2'),5'-bisphosphate nucleotidase CysQ [Longimicrobium terrae]
MPEYSLDEDLELAIRGARAAGDAVMRAFRVEQEVRYKSPEQPVTEADLAADRALYRVLMGERPEYGWLSEESADSPERLKRRRVWVVDPIDGTNSFVAGRPEFAVCVGLVDGDRAVVGVVLNPATGEMYSARDGGGAFRNGEPIHVAAPGSHAPRIVASRWEMKRGEFDGFGDAWSVEPLGSTAYKMCRVAEGGAEAFVSRGPKSEWDVAAAVVIVREAGGRVTRIDGAEPVFNQPNPDWRGIATSNGAVHDELLRISSQPLPVRE